MSINITFITLFLACTVFLYVNPQDAIREYFIRKDILLGFKAGEFTVSDPNEKNTFYRIKSDYGMLQYIKIIAYPSKKEVGRLNSKLKFFLYKAEISILDSQKNQWINGHIKEKFKLFSRPYSIDWNGHRITMEVGLFVTSVVKFEDTNGALLAQFKLRPSSLVLVNKYDMKIFSDKYPDQIYLLGLAAHDHVVTKNAKNGKG